MTIEELIMLQEYVDDYLPNDDASKNIIALIDAEIERQEPCDACNNGKHGKTFKIDIKFGKRVSLNFCYCPTCGRKLDQQ